jgi:2,5-diketo-D-gluconate reductase A
MKIQSLNLNDGNSMPQLGYGLWQVPDDETEKVVKNAIEVGYRSIDSAQVYGNEKGLGGAIRNCGLARKELYITTKIWNTEQGYDTTLRSFDESMKKLGTEYLDLLLIHWPAPKKNLYVDTWKALVQLKKDGRVRSIGVSNFYPEHIDKIVDATSFIPAVNQIECHPRFQQHEFRKFHDKLGIKTESWSPLGQGKVLEDEIIKKVAQKHGKTPAQVIIRWHLDSGLIAIPKSITPSRIAENFHVFGFSLDADDMKLIASMDDKNGRIGPDPMNATF